MKKLFLMFLFIFLSACTITPKQIELKNKFDVNEAKRLMKDGKNTIKGSALLRQVGGGIQTCAGEVVTLFPFTKYAEERMSYLYANTERGYYNFHRSFIFNPNEAAYAVFVKREYCDVDGRFTFEKVADGTFFVVAPVRWSVVLNQYGATQAQGGILMQKVTVKNGEMKRVVLSGN